MNCFFKIGDGLENTTGCAPSYHCGVIPMHKGVSTLPSIYRLVTDYFMMFSNPFSLILTSDSGVEPPEISKERRY